MSQNMLGMTIPYFTFLFLTYIGIKTIIRLEIIKTSNIQKITNQPWLYESNLFEPILAAKCYCSPDK